MDNYKLKKDNEDELVEKPTINLFKKLNWKIYNAFNEEDELVIQGKLVAVIREY